MIEIIPSILTDSPEEFEKMVRLIEPYSPKAHLDVADGVFVDNETVSGYKELELISTGLKFDVHLMVARPEIEIEHWYDLNNIDSFIIHAETEPPMTLLNSIHNHGHKVGLALNPDTPINVLDPLLNQIEFVHFMTVYPGFYGAQFVDNVVDKIADFHKLYPDIPISVDGGMNTETVKKVAEAGATTIISGSYLLKSGNVGKAMESLRLAGMTKPDGPDSI